MKSSLTKLLCGLAVCAVAASASSLTIIPTFDGSITNDPNGVAMTNAIDAAIQVLQSDLTDNVTVKVHFTNDPSIGLGQSLTWGANYNYSSYLSALRSSASSVNDSNALSNLPNSSVDPVIGHTKIHLTLPQARLTGLDSGYGPDGFDSTISLNMPLMNFTRPGLNPNNYDLQETAAHELDEVLGISSGLPTTSIVWPVDLFRYTTNLARTFVTSGDDAYFSVDGTNLFARYNMDPSGDYGDWWSASDIFWAPPGNTPHSQVQDAFGEPGVYDDLGPNELAALDIVGWTLAVTTPPITPPALKIVHSSAGQITLSWSNTISGLTLQERTNLISGLWIPSVTGTSNPAVILTTATRKFYRLYYHSLTPSVASAPAAAMQSLPPSALELDTRVLRPRKP